MNLPYGYVLVDGEIVIHEKKADVVRGIFECYLAGVSLGKVVEMLKVKGIPLQLVTSNGHGPLSINF